MHFKPREKIAPLMPYLPQSIQAPELKPTYLRTQKRTHILHLNYNKCSEQESTVWLMELKLLGHLGLFVNTVINVTLVRSVMCLFIGNYDRL